MNETEKHTKIYKRAKKIHSQMKKENKNCVYLYGQAGSGKTTISGEYFKNYKKGRKKFLILSDYFDELIKEQAEKGTYLYKLDDLKKIDFLVLDDVGVEKYSEFREEIIYKIINYRYENKLSTAFTSNLKLAELGELYSDRISSRIKAMSFVAYMGDVDFRNN